jgi:hypothetical protein
MTVVGNNEEIMSEIMVGDYYYKITAISSNYKQDSL